MAIIMPLRMPQKNPAHRFEHFGAGGILSKAKKKTF